MSILSYSSQTSSAVSRNASRKPSSSTSSSTTATNAASLEGGGGEGEGGGHSQNRRRRKVSKRAKVGKLGSGIFCQVYLLRFVKWVNVRVEFLFGNLEEQIEGNMTKERDS